MTCLTSNNPNNWKSRGTTHVNGDLRSLAKLEHLRYLILKFPSWTPIFPSLPSLETLVLTDNVTLSLSPRFSSVRNARANIHAGHRSDHAPTQYLSSPHHHSNPNHTTPYATPQLQLSTLDPLSAPRWISNSFLITLITPSFPVLRYLHLYRYDVNIPHSSRSSSSFRTSP